MRVTEEAEMCGQVRLLRAELFVYFGMQSMIVLASSKRSFSRIR